MKGSQPEDSAVTIFHVIIDGGPTRVVEVRTGLYWLAVAHALAQYGFDEEKGQALVKIWSPGVVEDYGPYWYGLKGGGIFSIAANTEKAAQECLDNFDAPRSGVIIRLPQ